MLESYQQAPKMGLNSGPFGPIFSPFSKITISCQQAKVALTCSHVETDSNNIVLTMSFFGHSGGPSNLAKNLDNFGTQSRSVTAQKI